MTYDCRVDLRNTMRELSERGITCPDVADLIPVLRRAQAHTLRDAADRLDHIAPYTGAAELLRDMATDVAAQA